LLVNSLNKVLNNSTLNSRRYFSQKLNSHNFVKLKKKYSLNNLHLQKLRVTSNGSRNAFFIKSYIPFHLTKLKTFYYSPKSIKGRSKSGILCRTKGKHSFNKYPKLNNTFRERSLSLVLGFLYIPVLHKNYSLIISSGGSMSYIPATYIHNIFKVYKLYSSLDSNFFLKNYSYLSSFIKIPKLMSLILQLPKYKIISSLEIFPGKGFQYIQSSGSKGFLVKTDVKSNLALIKLPSGVHKIFSSYSTGFEGQIPFNQKKLKTRPNAGFFKNFGKKSLSRGVAKNPVDHPHGGRNKAIKYQRTP
jgi:ribosomal protein L2